MTLNIPEMLDMLAEIAQAAATTGLVPEGRYTLILAGIVTGLHAAADSDLFRQGATIELADIGNDFDAAMAHMRAVLAARAPLPETRVKPLA
jgi:hypothetical protein